MIQPLNTKVLVKKPEPKTQSGGILLPDAVEILDRGVVVAKGKDVEEVGVGDTVIMAKYCGMEVEHDAVKYRMIDHKDILAIIS